MMPAGSQNKRLTKPHNQRGQALIAITALLGITLLVTVYAITGPSSQTAIDQQKTADALAQAKAALIGYAIAAAANASDPDIRPGDLPCPDNHPANDTNEGMPTTPCPNNALGRLPWRFLGLPDLRDGSGERLWYAVSTNYKNNPRTSELNNNTYGTITVRNSNGTVVNNGTDLTAAIAVVIAPGSPFTRQDGIGQNRAGSGYTDPKNYLDIANGEDNAKFVDGNLDGFIQGEIHDSQGNIVLNDKLIAITYNDLMPLLEKRVAGTIKLALDDFHEVDSAYPYAASESGSCPAGINDGWLGVNPPPPPPANPSTSCAPIYPSWIFNWYEVARYHKINDNEIRLSFDSSSMTCASSFLITWNFGLKMDSPCVP